MIGLIGRKVGMTQIFDANGERLTVTVVKAGPCVVTELKTKERDGYQAVQLGFEALKKNSKKKKRITKAMEASCKKKGIEPAKVIKEFRVDDVSPYKIGQVVDLNVFEGGKFIDVTGITIGRGTQGVVKRHGMRGGPETHGSNFHRRPGSIGANTDPARVWKGKRMGGHMGCIQVTMRNLKLVEVDKENNILLFSGSAPGNDNDIVYMKLSKKQK